MMLGCNHSRGKPSGLLPAERFEIPLSSIVLPNRLVRLLPARVHVRRRVLNGPKVWPAPDRIGPEGREAHV
jgi:hypothetical protein